MPTLLTIRDRTWPAAVAAKHTSSVAGPLGDGAAWIWNFADEHFPHAIQIVDIFHAKGHLFEVAKAIYGPGSEIGQQWARKWREELDEGRIHDVITALRSHAESCEEARKNTEYFSSNRLKQGGMHWTVNGANAILALRCAVESNRFGDFREPGRRRYRKSHNRDVHPRDITWPDVMQAFDFLYFLEQKEIGEIGSYRMGCRPEYLQGQRVRGNT